MGRKLYVGNLPYSATEQTLRDAFSAHGTVDSASVITDRDTGQSKGFGFVEMSTDQEAQAATQAMNLMFVGPLKHSGLALAIGLGACLNAALLYRQLRRQSIYQPEPGWGRFALKIGVAVLSMAAALWLGGRNRAPFIDPAWVTGTVYVCLRCGKRKVTW